MDECLGNIIRERQQEFGTVFIRQPEGNKLYLEEWMDVKGTGRGLD